MFLLQIFVPLMNAIMTECEILWHFALLCDIVKSLKYFLHWKIICVA